MKKNADYEQYQQKLMDQDVAHLVYDASGLEDLIHPYAAKGYELLSDNLTAFLNKYQGLLPAKAPVVLEVTGCNLEDKQKELVDRTIATQYYLYVTDADKRLKALIKKVLIFLLFTILSTLLFWVVTQNTGELLTNLAYIPFYFFGYRVLIYALVDALPLWKERSWYKQLASLKLVFGGSKWKNTRVYDPKTLRTEIRKYQQWTEEAVQKDLIMNCLMEHEIVCLHCKVSSLADIIEHPNLPGRECMSAGLSGYLGQIESFFSAKNPIRLNLHGTTFSAEEKKRIHSAVDRYYLYRLAQNGRDWSKNLGDILFFSSFVVLSAVLLVTIGSWANAAWHEFILMLFWFFGDYALDFALNSTLALNKSKKILKNCRRMEIICD